MNSVCTCSASSHSRMRVAVNSGPLSERMCAGTIVFNGSISLIPGVLIPITDFDDSPSFTLDTVFGF